MILSIHKKMTLSTLDQNFFLQPSSVDQKFKDLFNTMGPYYNCYPILGKWQNFDELKVDYAKGVIDFFKKNPNKPITLYVHIPYCAKMTLYKHLSVLFISPIVLIMLLLSLQIQ